MRAAAYFVVLISVLLVLAGCGERGAAPPTASELTTFDSAKPELKQMWAAALQADKSNDYASAHRLLTKISTEELSTDQREVLKKQFSAFNARFQGALEKSDPAAMKALQEIRSGAR